MKNKFLLLGATALLSTGAILANASDLDGMSDTITDFHVKAEIVNTLNLREVKPLDFGRIAWETSSETSTLDMHIMGESELNFIYGNVTFHDGAQLGEICFTDLIPTAELGRDLRISMDHIALYAENETSTPIPGTQVDFQLSDVAATPVNSGERCYYVGGRLTVEPNAKASFPAGKLHGEATITVIYDSVN